MPLRRLDRPIKVRSRLLGDLWLVPAAADTSGLDAPAYTVEECLTLLAIRPAPQELRAIHLAKRLFDGELGPAGDPDRARQQYARLMQEYEQISGRLEAGSLDEEGLLHEVCAQLNRLAAAGGRPPR